jgi:hypothetical protein
MKNLSLGGRIAVPQDLVAARREDVTTRKARLPVLSY